MFSLFFANVNRVLVFNLLVDVSLGGIRWSCDQSILLAPPKVYVADVGMHDDGSFPPLTKNI